MGSLFRASVLALSLGGLALSGCKNASPGGDRPAKVAEVAFKNEKGQLACPVMGDVIATPAAAVAREEYQGKAYYFCCSSCVKAFKKDPDKYADGKYLRAKHEKDAADPSSCDTKKESGEAACCGE